ncbi:hypothetical protein pEaSNUABM14_00268 [Erwinia phage pEa_SNUABM_14]|uniref:Uncharacterized protein n=1 Tax=Erwinia phage pEa_SNUABM_7 TaxID=2866695 RepID=A0AAE7WTT1_9CAUD|nr:hypothetical protein MPK74_gp269 [Erwinia phage pEa_SNUABM_7]QYW04593.1 hypothetical protein pEaSNUABM14_00268 [Erwinia phage pEa_SNUABM_14]QYW04937.1 hypothetical protein pEaSNUABM7_00269 [Erwinia phage pEa_SNUABM_7]
MSSLVKLQFIFPELTSVTVTVSDSDIPRYLNIAAGAEVTYEGETALERITDVNLLRNLLVVDRKILEMLLERHNSANVSSEIAHAVDQIKFVPNRGLKLIVNRYR